MNKINTDIEKIKKLVSSRYIEAIFPSKDFLEEFLMSGKKIRIYIGVDPTGPQIHLGHSTNFLLLKEFQELGHEIIFLIGDFTAQIGDPTGKSTTRNALTKKEVLENCRSYKSQVSKIIEFNGKNPVKLKLNGEWYEKMPLSDVINLMAKCTHGQMVKRDMFQKRIKEEKEIYLHEFLYPLLQGYDSVMLNADAEIGGNDQTFNMLMGRDLVKEYQKREKFVIATRLLINPKTQKKMMSKSEGNFIALNAKSETMFGQIMSMADETIIPCFELCTNISNNELKKIKENFKDPSKNPRDLKAKLAKEIITIYHNKKSAEEAEEEFNKIFRDKQKPTNIKKHKIRDTRYKLVDLLVEIKLASSKGEARRLVQQGGVRINDVVQKDFEKDIEIKNEMIVQVGKRRFVKIKI